MFRRVDVGHLAWFYLIRVLTIVALVVLALTMLSCSRSSGDGNWVAMNPDQSVQSDIFPVRGTVRYAGLDRTYVIVLDDGTQFNPINLPDRFKINGVQVEAQVRRRNDVFSTEMKGPMIEILRIREASEVDTGE
jgi:hypothetical protein